MADRPIIFSDVMVHALLAGHKTQTRRPLKPLPEREGDPYVLWPVFDYTANGWRRLSGVSSVSPYRAAPYAPGDRLFPAMSIPSLNRNYCADLHGRIWSRAHDGETWELLKGSPTSKGYLSVTPAHEGRYRTRLVHRLVAEAFYGHEPNGLKQVRHLNGDQTDNAPENLDWGTQEDNWSDRLAHGRDTGERHHAAKLTSETVEAIRRADLPQRAIAARFGVAQSTVWAIKTGRYWQEAPQPNPVNCPRWASRLTLHVSEVRVQRLQEISDDDAWEEGIRSCAISATCDGPMCERNPSRICGNGHCDAPIRTFAHLWESIHGEGAWASNPWVCGITFSVERANIDEARHA